MKKALWLGIVVLGMQAGTIKGQEQDRWPSGSSSVSLYAGTFGFVTPLGVQFEHLWHHEKSHLGISTGLLNSFYDGFNSAFLGGYLAMVYVIGMNDHHFEGRIGASYHPIYLYPSLGAKNNEIPFMPVVALGYRFQQPGGKRYYRVSFGTGGIGAGIGFVLNQPGTSKPEKH